MRKSVPFGPQRSLSVKQHVQPAQWRLSHLPDPHRARHASIRTVGMGFVGTLKRRGTNVKSVVEVEIGMPLQEVAELFADPRNTLKWMHDLKCYEPVSGEQGMPGSTYRLIPKAGDMVFLATVGERNLPHLLRLNLEASAVDVAITGTLIRLSPTRTKLVSEEEFTFKGSDNANVGSSVNDAIKAAHRRHIEVFKRFAEHRWPTFFVNE